MAKQVLNNGETGLVIRTKINDNYTELYDKDSSQDTDIAGKADINHTHTGVYEPADPALQNHLNRTDNPHSVGKSAVGLGNADNTSDVNKPVSTAQQIALDGKSDTTHNHAGVYEPADPAIQAHITSPHAPADANNYVHPSTHPSTMITGLGTAATKYTGTSSGNVVELETGGALPAVSGANLTNLPKELSTDQQAALDGAASPNATNVLATISDVNGVPTGDMQASVYDPTNQSRDTFLLANMVEDSTHVIMSDTERSAIQANSAKVGITSAEQSSIVASDSHIADVTTNPHSIDKEAVGLGNVDNTADVDKPVNAHTHTLSDVTDSGTAATRDTGTGVHNVVMLDDNAKIPAVDGSQLTNLPVTTVAMDDLTDATITSPSATQVLTWDGAKWVNAAAPSGGGSSSGASSVDSLVATMRSNIADDINTSAIDSGTIISFTEEDKAGGFVANVTSNPIDAIGLPAADMTIASKAFSSPSSSSLGIACMHNGIRNCFERTSSNSHLYRQSYDKETLELTGLDVSGLTTKYSAGNTSHHCCTGSDGLHWAEIFTSGDTIVEYTLTTPWDFSTLTYARTVDLSSDLSSYGYPLSISYSISGDTLILVYNDSFHTYPLATPWDSSTHGAISTTTIGDATSSFPPGARVSMYGCVLKDDGTGGFIIYGGLTTTIYPFTLTSAWDFSTYVALDSPTATTSNYFLYGHSLNGEGKIFYDLYQTQVAVFSASWDVTSFVGFVDYSRTESNWVFDKSGLCVYYQFNSVDDKIAAFLLKTRYDLDSIDETKPQMLSLPDDGETYYIPSGTFSNDGELFACRGGVTPNFYLRQFKLRKPFLLDTAYDYTTYDIGVDIVTTDLTSMCFTPDGSTLYVNYYNATVSDNTARILLDSPYDLSTAHYDTTGAQQFVDLSLLAFKPGGLAVTYERYNYTLSVAFDLYSTKTSDGNASYKGFYLDHGKKFLYRYGSSSIIQTATLPTPYTYSSRATSSAVSSSPIAVATSMRRWKDGQVIIADIYANTIYVFDIALDGSITYTGDSYTHSSYVYVIGVSSDGKYLYFSSTNEEIFQKEMTTPWDITTATIDVQSVSGSGRGFYYTRQFNADGTTMYSPSGHNQLTLYEWDLATPWDISTMSSTADRSNVLANYLDSFAFSPDGTKFTVSYNTTNLALYEMTVPWDVSTCSQMQPVTYLISQYSNQINTVAVIGKYFVCCIAATATYQLLGAFTSNLAIGGKAINYTSDAGSYIVSTAPDTVTITAAITQSAIFANTSLLSIKASRDGGATFVTSLDVAKKIESPIGIVYQGTVDLSSVATGTDIVVSILYDGGSDGCLRGLAIQYS